MPELNNRRHALVTAAHDFLLSVAPFRSPDSHEALRRFIAQAADLNCRPSDLRLVLIDVLSVLVASGSCARVLDRYPAARRLGADPLQQFALDVSQLIRTRVVGDRTIERGMAIVESHYSDAALSQAAVASQLGLSASYFATRFRERAGLKFSDYLRQTRLDAAARLLTTSDRRIKDIWVSVGYNDASNFDHQFKARFEVSPGEYRRRNNAEESRVSEALTVASDGAPQSPNSLKLDVLIVDDHENTRETVGRYLNSVGYAVATAASGSEGLETVVRRRPHSIVLDYHLPDMDGIAWLQTFREREASPPARVVLFTADLDVVARCELEALHATYLSKLCDIDELVAILRTAHQ